MSTDGNPDRPPKTDDAFGLIYASADLTDPYYAARLGQYNSGLTQRLTELSDILSLTTDEQTILYEPEIEQIMLEDFTRLDGFINLSRHHRDMRGKTARLPYMQAVENFMEGLGLEFQVEGFKSKHG